MKQSVIVFARAPDEGRVKTRLAAAVGATQAVAIYRQLGARVLSQVRHATDCELVVAYTPPNGEQRVREWLPGADRYEPQPSGDLGRRMDLAMAGRFAAGAQRAVVIGTDCPSVDAAVVEQALRELDHADVVIGPAMDGGYYLIGLPRRRAALFERIPWSGSDTLRVTLERASALGLSVALLELRRDIDTADDWRAWQAEMRGQSDGKVSPEGR